MGIKAIELEPGSRAHGVASAMRQAELEYEEEHMRLTREMEELVNRRAGDLHEKRSLIMKEVGLDPDDFKGWSVDVTYLRSTGRAFIRKFEDDAED